MTKVNVLMLDLKSYLPSPPYQLGLVVSYALLEEEVKKNISFRFTEHPREQPVEEIATHILTSGADLVAASNYAWNYKKLCRILDVLSRSGARLPRIVLGGPNSEGAFGAEMLQRYPILSAMVEGEGEPAFRDICASLADSPGKDPFQNARNCKLRTPDGGVQPPKQNHRIQSLDEIPSPYLSGLIPAEPSPIFYETNRGCPYRCAFCYWGNGNSKIYRMSAERIREELEFFASKRVQAFWLADANFGIFKSDSEIAETMAEINARHGYPFKHVGVNWAKNCSDRVLEIGMVFRRGRMTCTTTLALQSVTPEAEATSRRYSMAPSKFVNLISTAEKHDLDTYTDIIWGLPGEGVEEYLDGLDAVISTGVPSILIHQLSLLPGTEFFDQREKFGFELLRETSGEVDPAGLSDYSDYIVVSHPKMSREDMRRGTRLLGVNHLLHNHDLGRVVDFYLARYGVRHRDVYAFFDDALLGRAELPVREDHFFERMRGLILMFANSVGLDESIFCRRLSEIVWFKRDVSGQRVPNEPAVRSFMHDFYEAFCRTRGVCKEPAELELLSEFIDYNVLISPKPLWKPAADYVFKFDVHRMWQDIHARIGGDRRPLNGPQVAGLVVGTKKDGNGADCAWAELSSQLRAELRELLSDDYIDEMRRPVRYRITNPWMIPPSFKTSDWQLSSRSKHCGVSLAEA